MYLPSLNTCAPSDHAALLSLLLVLLGNHSAEKPFVAALLLQLKQNCTFSLLYKETSWLVLFLLSK